MKFPNDESYHGVNNLCMGRDGRSIQLLATNTSKLLRGDVKNSTKEALGRAQQQVSVVLKNPRVMLRILYIQLSSVPVTQPTLSPN